MNIFTFFKHLFVKAENGLDKLISAETRVDTALHDCLISIEQQKENAKHLITSKLQYDAEVEKLGKEVSRFHTQCEVLKNKGFKPEDDDLRIAATQYLDTKKVYDEMSKQQEELAKQQETIEKMLKHLKLNKSLLETKANMLKTKIKFYKMNQSIAISQSGIVDIDSIFSDVTEVVDRMNYENQASERVNDLVNGRESQNSIKDAEIDDFLNNL